MKRFRWILIACLLLAGACSQIEELRQVVDFTEDWRFTLSDTLADYSSAEVDVTDWRTLNLPHDWSIESDFSADYPATPSGGALPGGVGWYRKTFTLDKSLQKKAVHIYFDGVYQCSEIWINGRHLGFRPYGYIPFRYNLTPYIQWGKENTIAVRVDNSKQPNSRWYSGSGIYRNVRLEILNPVHLDWGAVYITTPKIDKNEATVKIQTTLPRDYAKIRYIIRDATGTIVAGMETPDEEQNILVPNPTLWSVDTPYLYTLIAQLEIDGVAVDKYETQFGIRSFVFDTEKGFILNGKPLKINGVCNHHDLGCLGAAVNVRAIERQLQILKKMGCNGIRCSHNPPSSELLDLCDKMGFIVMNEAFDMWAASKTKFDYSRYFSEWHVADLTNFILRDRNHPSVFMWSIGNEIIEQWLPNGDSLATHLANIVRTLDPTRPIVSACNEPSFSNPFFRPGILDIVGLNYHLADYEKVHTEFADRPFIASETVSGLASRGFYQTPSDSFRIWGNPHDIPDSQTVSQCSAYDNCHVPWGSSHEESWKYIKKTDFVAGQYIWTGFDYLGEPTPYGWPARSSYFGIVDLAGFPKDVYYMYQSEWTSKDVLHLFPHWNWKTGETVDILAYYNNADEVELFLNNRSLGVKNKENDDLHVRWRLPYEPGALRAVSRKAGKEVLKREIKTAGSPAVIRLTADRNTIKASGKDLSFITVEVLDSSGNPVPVADNLIRFTIEGPGLILGTDNGDPTDCNSLKKPERKLFNGKCLLVIQGTKEAGAIKITASSDNLKNGVLKVKNR
jgi:beta-galactosidase